MTKKLLNPMQNPATGILSLTTQVKGFLGLFGFGVFLVGFSCCVGFFVLFLTETIYVFSLHVTVFQNLLK